MVQWNKENLCLQPESNLYFALNLEKKKKNIPTCGFQVGVRIPELKRPIQLHYSTNQIYLSLPGTGFPPNIQEFIYIKKKKKKKKKIVIS